MPGDVIDLRSDTITRPTAAMRAAIAAAPVGDDQFGEDPSVNALQDEIAGLLGKEAALWLPTGTMANQVALRVLTRPGDDVVVSRESHIVWHETGGGAANAGVQFTEIGHGGTFTAEEFAAACKPQGHLLHPPTTLVVVENTHNRAGGIVVPHGEVEAICAAARERHVSSLLDGARLWNAAVATGQAPARLAAPFDVVWVALSKGLGAPAGAVLAGPRDVIVRAVRYRRMFGGAMRQVGLLAAAGSYAIAHHLTRLPEDHAHARLLAENLAQLPGVILDLTTVQTNIVVFHLRHGAPDAAAVVAGAKEAGVLLFAFGPRLLRAVTHLEVSREQCVRASHVLGRLVSAHA